MKIADYLDRARAQHQLKSDRQLAQRLGLSHSVISHFRLGFICPAPDTMTAIADLAGVDHQQALLDLIDAKLNSPQARARKERERIAREQQAADVETLAAVMSNETDPNKREALGRILKKMRGPMIGAAIACAAVLGTNGAQAATQTEGVYIVSSLRAWVCEELRPLPEFGRGSPGVSQLALERFAEPALGPAPSAGPVGSR